MNLHADDPRLTAYVLGELDDAERAAVEQHLAECEESRRAVAEIRRTAELLSGKLANEPLATLTGEQLQKIEAAMPKPPAKPARRWRRYYIAGGALVAASVLLVLLPRLTVVHPFIYPNGDALVALAEADRKAESELRSAVLDAIQGINPDSWDDGLDRNGQRQDGLSESVEEGTLSNPGGPPMGQGRFRPGQGSYYRDPQDLESPAAAVSPPARDAESSRDKDLQSQGQEDLRLWQMPGEVDRGERLPAGASSTGRGFGRGGGGQRGGEERARERTNVGATTELERLEQEGSREGASRERLSSASASGNVFPGQKPDDSPAKPKAPTTWKRSPVVPNATRLTIGENESLPLKGMQVQVRIDGFRARVILDSYYENDRRQQLEGNFQLRLPDEASPYYFAFGETVYRVNEERPEKGRQPAFLRVEDLRGNGTRPEDIRALRLGTWNAPREARMVQKEKAALAYRETVHRRRVDPALVEWAGAGVFSARVFPLVPGKLHRVVVGYDVDLQRVGDEWQFRLDLPETEAECIVDIDGAVIPGATVKVDPVGDVPVVGGRNYYRFENPRERSLLVHIAGAKGVALHGADAAGGDYFAAALAPELPADAAAGASRGVFLVDVSLSAQPASFEASLKLLQAILENNRATLKQFAVAFFNVETFWWREGFRENTEANVAALLVDANGLSLEGATDLARALAEASHPAWLQDAAERHDVFLLSDGAVTWGENDLYRLSQSLEGGSAGSPGATAGLPSSAAAGAGSSRSAAGSPGGDVRSSTAGQASSGTPSRSAAGSLFAYVTGMGGSDPRTLQHLARETGGAVFAVTGEAQIAAASVAHRQRPWKLESIEIAGGKDLLLAGRPETLFPGQSLRLVGRGKPEAGSDVVLTLSQGAATKTIRTKLDHVIDSELAVRTYGQVAVGQLESFASTTEDVAIAFARHFRVTGQTCSLLMLESEADYQRFQIIPEDDALMVKTQHVAAVVARTVEGIRRTAADPKAAFLAWVDKRNQLPGMELKLPAALRLLLDGLPASAFTVAPASLRCDVRQSERTPEEYRRTLAEAEVNRDAVLREAERRLPNTSDALRVLSSLVERDPGDPVVLRDVAFSAIEWDLGGHAYHLFRRVAESRPFEPQSYHAAARSLSDLGHQALALVYYEMAWGGQWDQRFREFRRIVAVDYLHFLSGFSDEASAPGLAEFAASRRQTLAAELGIERADLVIMIQWNTDDTDVDLYVTEPTNETCYYTHPQTRTGGRLLADVTEGYGPEMYILKNAIPGRYTISADYYRSDPTRTSRRTKVLATVYEGWGAKAPKTTRKTATLAGAKQKQTLLTLEVAK